MAKLPVLDAQISSLYDSVDDTLISREKEYKTEIGNRANKNRSEPHLKIRKWADTSDECWLACSFIDALPGNSSTRFNRDKFVWSKGGYEVQIYSTGMDEGGGHNIDILVPRRPPVDSYTLKLEHNGCVFYYQPALTQAQIDAGHIRPENVVGSYAVYRADAKSGHFVGRVNYKTGKICHIYRPLITDALGDSIYADLSYNEAASELTISIDPTWLDNAAYPILIDPDFGYTTAGASNQGFLGTRCYGNTNASYIHTASTGDTITSYTIRAMSYTSGTCYISGYSVSAGLPSSRLASSATEASITATGETPTDYQSNTVSHALSNGVDYTIAVNGGPVDDAVRIFYDAGVGDDLSIDTADTALPASWTHAAYNAELWTMYATYTAGGGGPTGLFDDFYKTLLSNGGL